MCECCNKETCLVCIYMSVVMLTHLQLKRTRSNCNNRILLKLSGDGASFSQSTQFVFLTFSCPEIASDVLAASGV